MNTIGTLPATMFPMSSRLSGSYDMLPSVYEFNSVAHELTANWRSSRQKHINLHTAKSRKTSMKVFTNLEDLVDPPDRNQSAAVLPALPQCTAGDVSLRGLLIICISRCRGVCGMLPELSNHSGRSR